MKKIAIINFSNHKETIQCSCRDCIKKEDENVEIYFSYAHAQSEGWHYTNHIKYCPPDEDGVWICPKCAEKEEWIK